MISENDVLLILHNDNWFTPSKSDNKKTVTDKDGDGFGTITESQLKDAMLFKQSFYVLDKVH